MTHIRIVLDGVPIAKKRTKCTCIGGHARIYDPQIKDEMLEVSERILEAAKSAGIVEKAISLPSNQRTHVQMHFVMPIPTSLSNRKQMALLGMPHEKKPDLDNLAKLYLDCGSGILWNDDAEISKLTLEKSYGDQPRTEIHIDWTGSDLDAAIRQANGSLF